MGHNSSTVSRLRAELGMTQTQFGDALGISQSAVSMIESGELALSAALALRMSDLWPRRVKRLGGVEVLLRGAAA